VRGAVDVPFCIKSTLPPWPAANALQPPSVACDGTYDCRVCRSFHCAMVEVLTVSVQSLCPCMVQNTSPIVALHIALLVSLLIAMHRRFGFANLEAIEAGQTGTACRGEEHDVTLVWSLTSGKRLILADGQEVHFSHNRGSLFEFSWTMRGNNVLKVVAHASAPMTPTPGFRQYDFYVNGLSFFAFPKVFRLGLQPDHTRGALSPSSPAAMAETSRRYGPGRGGPGGGPGGTGGPRRSSAESLGGSSVNIANLEAPGNPDEVRVTSSHLYVLLYNAHILLL
jgi:hypothetical protein